MTAAPCCTRCTLACAAVWCGDCCPLDGGRRLCAACDAHLHSRGSRAGHARRLPLCGECGCTGAVLCCKQCESQDVLLCAVCWADVHGDLVHTKHAISGGAAASAGHRPMQPQADAAPGAPGPAKRARASDREERDGSSDEPDDSSDGSSDEQDGSSSEASWDDDADDTSEDDDADDTSEDDDASPRRSCSEEPLSDADSEEQEPPSDEGEPETTRDRRGGGDGQPGQPSRKRARLPSVVARAVVCLRPAGVAAASREQLERIKKTLDRAMHPATPPAEAEQAMRIANLTMARLGVTHRDLEGERGGVNPGGSAQVQLVRSGSGGARIAWQAWHRELAACVSDLCSVNCYTSQHPATAVTFYGLWQQVELAAQYFEELFNRMPDLVRQADVRGARQANSYRSGIIQGLRQRAADARRQAQSTQGSDAESKEIVTYNRSAQSIADRMKSDMMRTGQIKVTRRRSQACIDPGAYSRGKRDSANVQLGQRRIGDR